MKNSTLWAVGAAALLGGAAMAQETWTPNPDLTRPHGVEVGSRLGYSFPTGDIRSGLALTNVVSGMVPLQLDLGYRVNPTWFVGVYGQYGFVLLKDATCATHCSAHDVRFGLEAQYHLMPLKAVDPWAGLGVGYELLPVSGSIGGQSASQTLKGMEFVNLSFGADFKIAPALGVGPFLGLSIGEFSSFGDLGAISGKGVHLWLTLGVRSVFDAM